MAEANKNNKKLVIAVVVLVASLLPQGSAFMQATDEMRAETEKMQQEIDEVKSESAQFSSAWEKKIAEREKQATMKLPDSLNSSAVLDYFLSAFEKANTGSAWFLSVNYQAAANTEFKTGQGSATSVVRGVKYKIRAAMSQDRVVPYIDYMQQYPGLFRAVSFSFSVPKEAGTGLEMETTLEFFLSPKDWIAHVAGIAQNGMPSQMNKDGKDAEESSTGPKPWEQLFFSAGPAVRSVASTGPGPGHAGGRPAITGGKFPHIDRVMGNSILIDETLYEEGDRVHGWTIISVNSRTRLVTLKSGGVTRKVVVR